MVKSYLCVTAALMLGCTACSTSDCSDNRNSLPLAGFYSSSEPHQAVSIDTLDIGAAGAPGDSLLAVLNASEAYLPFNPDASLTSFVFRYNRVPEALFDTVGFRYETTPWFESQECGVVYLYKVEGIDHTTHFIDSVSCPAGVIDNKPGQNLRVYFRTTENENDLPQ